MGDSLKNRAVWHHINGLSSGATLSVELGMEGSGTTVLNAQDVRRLTFGLETQLACTLNIQGSMWASFAVFNVICSVPVLAATYTTPYDLPAPMNETGYLMITRPFLRIQIVETALANHTYTHFWAIAWW